METILARGSSQLSYGLNVDLLVQEFVSGVMQMLKAIGLNVNGIGHYRDWPL